MTVWVRKSSHLTLKAELYVISADSDSSVIKTENYKLPVWHFQMSTSNTWGAGLCLSLSSSFINSVKFTGKPGSVGVSWLNQWYKLKVSLCFSDCGSRQWLENIRTNTGSSIHGRENFKGDSIAALTGMAVAAPSGKRWSWPWSCGVSDLKKKDSFCQTAEI